MRLNPLPRCPGSRLTWTDRLHRFLFFRWQFRDVLAGSQLERAAAWRHNVAHRPALYPYLGRWAMLSCAGLWLGETSQTQQGVNLGTAVGYSLAAFALQACVVIAILIYKLRGHYTDLH